MPQNTTIHEAVGAFHSPEAMEAAISRLASAGFDRADMSHLQLAAAASPEDARRRADDARAPRSAVVSDTDVRQLRTLATSMAGVATAFLVGGITILTGGTAAVAAVGAAVAGGGAAAAVNTAGNLADAGREQALDDQLHHGGILLWVRLHAPGQDAKATEIMRACGATNVHVHDIAAAT
jgi:hypothetical protein